MNMKSIVYSGFLLLGLVVVSILLNRGTIYGVASSADISLNLVGPAGSTLPNTLPSTLPSTGTSTNYIVGQVVSFSGTIAFAANEQQSLNQIRLVNDSGPQALDVSLPLAATSDYITLSDSSIPGTIQVKVTHTNITASYAYSTLGTMGNTIPGTLPSSQASGAWAGGTFKGLSGGGSIQFDVKWSPGIFLDPRPDFTLIPDTDLAFEVPTLPTPVAVSGTALPSTTAVYTIPTADASTASSVLPAGSGTFDVPTVTLTTTASGERATVPDLPALDRTQYSQGFAIPDLMSWDVGASKIATSTGSTYPATSLQYTVPTASADSAPSGVGTLASDGTGTALLLTAGDVGGSSAIHGLAAATSSYWFIKDDGGCYDGSSNYYCDLLVNVDDVDSDSNGFLDVLATYDTPSSEMVGVAYANNTLFVLENGWQWFDGNEHRIYKFSMTDTTTGAINLPTSAWNWTYEADAYFSTRNSWNRMGGVTTTGSDANASLWLGDEWGGEFYNMDQDGIAARDQYGWDKYIYPNPMPNSISGIGYSTVLGMLYTIDGGNSRLEQWDTEGNRLNQWSLTDGSSSLSSIAGLTVHFTSSKDVITIGAGNGSIYRTYAAASEATHSPQGITYAPSTVSVQTDQDRLWVLVDGSPNDKIIKLNPTTGAVVTWLDSTGRADAPDADTVGITYMGGSLYVLSNKSSGCCDQTPYIYKINSASAAVEATYNLNDTAQMWGEAGGISNDGTNLIVHKKWDNEIFFIDASDGSNLKNNWPCCPNSWGAQGVAYHTERQQLFVGNYQNAVTYPVTGSGWDWIGSHTDEETVTGVSSIKGMTFSGDEMFIIEDGTSPNGARIVKTFFADTAQTTPKGVAYTPSTDSIIGEAIWVVVDGEPKDKILKLSTSTGQLLSKTNVSTAPAFPSVTNDVGWVVAPNNEIEGITYMVVDSTSYLFLVGYDNNNPYVYQINASTGVLTNSYNLNSNDFNWLWQEIGGITTGAEGDGTLYVFMKYENKALKIEVTTSGISSSNEWWPCCPGAWGATALAYHEGREKFYSTAGWSFVTWDSSFSEYTETFPTLDGVMLSNEEIQGMTFAGDILFAGYKSGSDGYIATGALKPTATNDVQGLAYSPAGSTLLGANIGSALWAIVDGQPYDKILKLSTTTGSLITNNFPTVQNAVGWFNLPNNGAAGVTYMDGYLYVLATQADGCCDYAHYLYKFKATNGVQAAVYDLSQGPNGIRNHHSPSGMSNDGENIVIFNGNEDMWWEIDPTTGSALTKRHFGNDWMGYDAVARRAGTNQFAIANDGTLKHLGLMGGELESIKTHTLTSMTKVKGLVIDNGSTNQVTDTSAGNDLLYIAHDLGKISVTGMPSDKTNTPNALTTDGYNMYIVVETIGDSPDHVIVTTATSSAISNQFSLPQAGDANGITYLDGYLYVTIKDNECCGQRPVNVWKIDPATGVGEQLGFEFNENSTQGQVVAITNDGENLIVTGERGRDAFFFSALDGSKVQSKFFFDPNDFSWSDQGYTGLVRSATTSNLIAGSGKQLYKFDADGRKVEGWELPNVTSIQGLALLGTSGSDVETVYMAVSGSTNTFRSAIIPKPATVISENPRGLALDLSNASSTDIYMVIDATPVDKIIKVSATGTLDTNWGTGGVIDSPGSMTKGITYQDGFMWVLINDPQYVEICVNPQDPNTCGTLQGQVPSIHKLATTTAEFIEGGGFLLKVPAGSGIGSDPCVKMQNMGINTGSMTCEEYIKDKIAGAITSGNSIATDNAGATSTVSHLYIGMGQLVDGNSLWIKVETPASIGDSPIGTPVFQFSGSMPKLETYGAMAWTGGESAQIDDKFPIGRQFVAAGKIAGSNSNRTIARFDSDNVMFAENTTLATTTNSQFEMSTSSTYLDIRGLAYATSSRMIYIADNASNEVRTTLLPENTGQELTPVGSYSISLRATMTDGTTFNSGTTASTTYAIIKNPSVKIKFATLEDGFVATSSTATISGYVNDPSVTELSTGFDLPNTKFISDVVEAGTSTAQWSISSSSQNVGWHLACDDDDENTENFPGQKRTYTGDCAWRFGKAGEPNFRAGESPVSGTLTSEDVVTVGSDTKLTFWTGYMTESMQDIDQKVVEVALVSTDAQGNATTSDTWYAVRQLIGKGAEQFAEVPIQQPSSPGMQQPGMQQPSGGMGFQDPNMGMGFQDPNMGMGYQAPNMGMGYQDPNMGMQQPGMGGGGFQDPNMGMGGGGYQDPYMNDPYMNDPMMGGGGSDPYMNDPYMNDPMMGGNTTYSGGASGPAYYEDEPDSSLTLGAGFEYKELDPLFVNPDLVKVTVDLSAYEGKDLRIRFRFNSVDGYANDGEGWFIDDVEVSGKGEKKVTIATTALDTPVSVTEGSTTTWYYMAFTTQFDLEEGLNTINVDALQGYDPFLEGEASVFGYVDFTAPAITLSGLPDETNVLVQTLSGTVTELKLESLQVEQTTIVSTTTGATSSQVIFNMSAVPSAECDEPEATCGSYSVGVSLKEGTNVFSITATDSGGKIATTTHAVILDTKAPSGYAAIITVTSDGEALVGDQFFVITAAEDDSSGMDYVTLTGSSVRFSATSSVPALLYNMHELQRVVTSTSTGETASTTHVTLLTVQAGTPVGANEYSVTLYDKAGNSATTTTDLQVVSSRTNRNYYLFPDFNYMGLGLIPDDGMASTTDDAKIDRLMTQDVSQRVSDAFRTEMGGSVTLGDVVEQVNSYIETTDGGAFVVYSPGDGASDTLTDLKAFQGLTIKTKSTSATGTAVFKQAKVEGFSATQSVPIKYNIQGVFFKQGALPPDKELRVGYNLVAPHIMSDTAFTTVYRGALIPKELAVSALTFERDVVASVDSTGAIAATVTEAFSANSGPDLLKPTFSYWTYIVDDPDDTRVNTLGTQKGPTITP